MRHFGMVLCLQIPYFFTFLGSAFAGQRREFIPPVPEGLNWDPEGVFDKQTALVARVSPLEPKWNQDEEWVLCWFKKGERTPIKVHGKDLSFRFWMPQHQHGMMTEPQIRNHPRLSHCVEIQGVRFHMPGWWQLQVEWSRDGASESGRTEKAVLNWMVK
jgi:hypothetical protein